jgi:hypothetical protein
MLARCVLAAGRGRYPARMGATRPRAIAALLAALFAALVASSCVPSDSSESQEVDDGSDSATTVPVAPEFPDSGEVSRQLVVDGLVYDLTVRPADQVFWSLQRDEAECAADQIVRVVGADRLVVLGYRPATEGSALNEIALEDDERAGVVAAVEGCADMEQALAAVLYGAGRIPSEVATCLARGMARAGMLTPLVDAWAAGRAVDPFADGSAFATALLGNAEVCVPTGAFNWPHLRLPSAEAVIDADVPAGSSRSGYRADQATTSGGGSAATTTTPAAP